MSILAVVSSLKTITMKKLNNTIMKKIGSYFQVALANCWSL